MPKVKDWESMHDQIVNDLQTMSLSKTAERHGLNISTLWNYCKRKNITIVAKHYKKINWREFHDRIVNDLESLSLIEVSEKYELPYATLWKYCSRNCIKPKIRRFRKKSNVYIDWSSIHDVLVEDLKVLPLYQVAKKYKLTYSALVYYCRKKQLYFFGKKFPILSSKSNEGGFDAGDINR